MFIFVLSFLGEADDQVNDNYFDLNVTIQINVDVSTTGTLDATVTLHRPLVSTIVPIHYDVYYGRDTCQSNFLLPDCHLANVQKKITVLVADGEVCLLFFINLSFNYLTVIKSFNQIIYLTFNICIFCVQ